MKLIEWEVDEDGYEEQIAPPGKDADTAAQLTANQSEFISVVGFERDF